jgi:hypothetical protein
MFVDNGTERLRVELYDDDVVWVLAGEDRVLVAAGKCRQTGSGVRWTFKGRLEPDQVRDAENAADRMKRERR